MQVTKGTQMETTQWRILQDCLSCGRRSSSVWWVTRTFRPLCHDYDRCAEALGRFREQAEILPDRVAEYEQLLAELEDDIRRTELDNE